MSTYRIIGADGKEYGPITEAVVGQWISEGRLNALSRIQPEGSTDWKALSELPEFAARFSQGPPPDNSPPIAASTPLRGQAEADQEANGVIARDYDLDIGSCISRGWNLVMSNFWLTVGATALTYLLVAAASGIPFASLLITFVLAAGLDMMFLKLIRGEKAEFADIFAGFGKLFVPLMVFSIIGQMFTMLGFVLCIVPGIYALVVWLIFPPLLIIDKHYDFWPAMELSRKVVNRHWWKLFGFVVVTFLILLAGLLACGIGVLLALPVTTAATVYAYEDVFGSRARAEPAPAQLQPVPPA